MNKTATTLMLAVCLASAGCAKRNILVTVNGEPGAAERLRTKTISTQVAKDASVMSKQAERSVHAELQRSGFRVVPQGGQIIMTVGMGHGGYGVGKISTFGPVFTHLGSWETYQQQIDIVELDLSASENGQTFWEGRVSGSGEWVNDAEQQGGCIEELLHHIDENYTGEERCE